MTNTYFNFTSPLPRFTTADATALNNIFIAVEAAFGKLPSATELSQGARNFSIATGTANTYAVTVPFQLTAYNPGLSVNALIMIANTGPSTLNVNSLGQVTIKRADGAALQNGDLRASSINNFVFDGTAFRLTSFHGASETITAANASTSTTAAAAAAASQTAAAASAVSAAASAGVAQSNATTAVETLQGARFGLRNRLINGTFWVNQRTPGVFSGTATAGSFIRDRWKAGSSGAIYSISNSTLTISAGSVQQVVQGRNIPFNGPYTLSWTGTATATVNDAPVANGGTVTLTSFQHCTVSFSGGTVYLPQLEFGSTKTPYEARLIDLEILLCYEYYTKSYGMDQAPGTLDGAPYVLLAYTGLYSGFEVYNCMVDLSVKMRSAPTITIYSPTSGLPGRVWGNHGADVFVTIAHVSPSYFRIFATNGDFPAGNFIQFQWTADAEL